MNSLKNVTVVAMASLGINDFLHATRHPLIELFLVIYSDTPPDHTSNFFNAVSDVGHYLFLSILFFIIAPLLIERDKKSQAL